MYEFGLFRLDPQKRVLLRSSEPVPLTPKAFDTLLVLVQNSERVVSKDDLMKKVWPDSFVEESNISQNIFTLRKALGDAPETRYIVTIPGRGYQFTERVRKVATETQAEPQVDLVVESHSRSRVVVEQGIPRAIWALGAAVVLLGALFAGIRYYRSHPTASLSNRDTVVLADFTNTTGDSVFDDALKQGLSVQLEQSPFLTLVSEQRINDTLKLMGRSTGERLTPEIGREVCLRAGSKAMLTGSIAALGSEYVIGLKAVSCSTGDVLAQTQEQAASKEKVITALSDATTRLRRGLGESLATLQQFDVPLEQASTPSLEALKAYSLAYAQANKGQLLASIPLYKRAIELDPDFAAAYAHLGQAYANSSQEDLAVASVKQAFERRTRASEVEKLYITTRYYELVTREVEKRVEAFDLWTRMYPRNGTPHNDLAVEYVDMGRFDQGLTEAQDAIRLGPYHYTGYEVLGMAYLGLNRFTDAKGVRDKQIADGSGDHWDHIDLYSIAALENDTASMQREVQWAKGKTYEFFMLRAIAGMDAAAGKSQKAKAGYDDAAEAARRAGFTNIAKDMAVNSALTDAMIGSVSRSPQRAQALSLPIEDEHMRIAAGRFYALRGDSQRASAIADRLSADAPAATYINKVWVPVIRAEVEVSRGDSTKAIEWLRSASPYEFGWRAGLWPTYERGRAYLKAQRGNEAVAEFQRILEHRGSCFGDPLSPLLYALSHLQLARAQAMSGDRTAARKSYENFLGLWKDADPNLPILKQAKAEYASLR